jgi:hypothetical protein
VGRSDIGPRATHFSGYCCWFDVGPRAIHFTGYCCWFMWGLWATHFTGYCCYICGASGSTLYWVLLFVYVGPRATHLIGYCWFKWHLGQHTLLAIVVGLWGASDIALYWVLLWTMRGFGQHTLLGIKRATIRQISYSQLAPSPQNVRRTDIHVC